MTEQTEQKERVPRDLRTGLRWAQLTKAMRRAAPGTTLEVGAAYNVGHGWRAYYRIGNDRTFLQPTAAIALVALFKKHGMRGWRGKPVDHAFDQLYLAALHCQHKNEEEFVPTSPQTKETGAPLMIEWSGGK